MLVGLLALDHARMFELELLLHVTVDGRFEERHPHHVQPDDDAGNERQERDEEHDPFDIPLARRIEELLLVVFQHPDDHVGRQRDEDRIDEKEVEGADEELELPRRKTEARRTEGRHQRRGDRDARNDRRIAILARLRHDTRQSAEESDQHVVSRRNRARQQLALRSAQRRNDEIERRGQNAHEHHEAEIAHRTLQQVEIVDADRQSHAHDRAHQRRNEHRADDDGRRVDIQAQGSHKRREYQHPEIRAAKIDPAADIVHHLVLQGAVLPQIETVPEKTPQRVERRSGSVISGHHNPMELMSAESRPDAAGPSAPASRRGRPPSTTTISPLGSCAAKWAATSASVPRTVCSNFLVSSRDTETGRSGPKTPANCSSVFVKR